MLNFINFKLYNINHFQVVPEGLSGSIRWLREEYDDPEIFVTENGYCGCGDNDDDEARIYYFSVNIFIVRECT